MLLQTDIRKTAGIRINQQLFKPTTVRTAVQAAQLFISQMYRSKLYEGGWFPFVKWLPSCYYKEKEGNIMCFPPFL